MLSDTHLPPHILSLMDALLSTKSPYWFPTPSFIHSDEVQLVFGLWKVTLTQWIIRWMEYKEMRGRESGREDMSKKNGKGEEKGVFKTERRGYGNTGGVNERWRENPYEYRRVGGAGEVQMRLSDPTSLHGFHGSPGRMERESLVVPGGELHPREASMRVRETTPSHDFHVPSHRMERESLNAPPSHDFHVSSDRMERESLGAAPSHDFHVSRNTTPSHDFHVSRNTTPSDDFHVLSHRMERESLVVVGGEELHPREASMTFRNSPPANENIPSSQDYHNFLMEIEGTPFLNSMKEAGCSAQQRRR